MSPARVQHLPRRKLPAHFLERKAKPQIDPARADGRDDDASRAQHALGLGEERPMQKVEDDHEVERLVLERQRRLAFQVENARIDAVVVLPHQTDRFLGAVDGRDAPSLLVEPERVAAGAAGEIEGASWRQRRGTLDEQPRGCEVELLARAIPIIPFVEAHSLRRIAA